MISKVFITGKGFGESCAYVCQDLQRAEILDMNGVREYNLRLMTADFKLEQGWANQVKEKPVFHAALTFPNGEDPGDEKLVEIAREYLKEIRMAQTQYVVVKHTDKAHLHLHIVANRVSHTGEIVGEGLVIERGIKAARKLTEDFELTPDNGKQLEQTNLHALHEPDAKRYRLYLAIHEVLPSCRRLEDLEMRLLERGISTRYRIDRASGERQGVSFRIENHSFKGSTVDKAYSLKGLERVLALQNDEVLKQDRLMEQNQEMEGRQKQDIDQRQKRHKEESIKPVRRRGMRF